MNIIDVKYEWAGALAKRSTIDLIVLHHADAKSCKATDVHWWHVYRGWSGIGYHFFVNKKGQVFRGRPENVIGAHAEGYNSTSLGICFEGNFQKEVPTQAQIDAGLKLVQYLKKKYNIKKVKGHKDLMATSCPGRLFPMEQFVGEKENLVLNFQRVASADGFKFDKYGCDGKFGAETESVMQKCIVKKRLVYKYKNSTKLVQRLLGVEQDGKCGKTTSQAIKKFQEQNGLSVDACVGLNTWKKLLNID